MIPEQNFLQTSLASPASAYVLSHRSTIPPSCPCPTGGGGQKQWRWTQSEKEAGSEVAVRDKGPHRARGREQEREWGMEVHKVERTRRVKVNQAVDSLWMPTG